MTAALALLALGIGIDFCLLPGSCEAGSSVYIGCILPHLACLRGRISEFFLQGCRISLLLLERGWFGQKGARGRGMSVITCQKPCGPSGLTKAHMIPSVSVCHPPPSSHPRPPPLFALPRRVPSRASLGRLPLSWPHPLAPCGGDLRAKCWKPSKPRVSVPRTRRATKRTQDGLVKNIVWPAGC